MQWPQPSHTCYLASAHHFVAVMITVLRHQTVVDTKKKHGTSAIDGMGWPQGWYSVHPFALQNSVIQRRLLWILLKSLRHFLFPPPCSFTPALCPGCFQIWLNRLSGVSSFWFAYAIKEFAERDLIIIFPIKIFFDRYPAFSDTRASTIYYCMCSFLRRCWHRFYNWVKTAALCRGVLHVIP